MPDTWKGLPPSLPQEVVRELAERARVAARALRMQRASQDAKKRPPIRVRASVQPTFVRYVFELPEGTGANTVLNEKMLAVKFNSVLNFDLADAKLAAPSNVASISQKTEGEASTVEVGLIGDVDIHSFREERNYIVDIGFQQPEKPSILPSLLAASRLRRRIRGPRRQSRQRGAPAGNPARSFRRRRNRSPSRQARHHRDVTARPAAPIRARQIGRGLPARMVEPVQRVPSRDGGRGRRAPVAKDAGRGCRRPPVAAAVAPPAAPALKPPARPSLRPGPLRASVGTVDAKKTATACV